MADLVTRYLVVDERPSQSLYAIPSALAQSDPTVSAFERWVRERLSEPISNPQAAKAIGVSERTLQRRPTHPGNFAHPLHPGSADRTSIAPVAPQPSSPWRPSPGKSATNIPTPCECFCANAPAKPPRPFEACNSRRRFSSPTTTERARRCAEMSCAPRRSAGAARCQPWATRRCATRSRFAYQQVCPATHEVVPGLVELEVAVPRSRPAVW